MERQRRPTSSDVARRAGVSRATVSFVLNDQPGKRVSPETRDAVLRAVRDLNYQPSSAARVLRLGRSEVVAILMPDWAPATAMDLFLAELGNRLAIAGLACVRNYGEHWRGRLSTLWSMISPAAVVTLEPLADDDVLATRNAGIPEVASWFLDSPRGPHQTLISQTQVSREQVDYLVARGHRRLAYVTTPDQIHRSFSQARIRGFRSACHVHSLPISPVRNLPATIPDTTAMLRACLAETSPPTAICAYSDAVAFGLLASAREAGISVPDDIAIIGVDDIDVARFGAPSLTTVRFNLAQEAAVVTRRVCEAVGVPAPPDNTPAAPTMTVIARESA